MPTLSQREQIGMRAAFDQNVGWIPAKRATASKVLRTKNPVSGRNKELTHISNLEFVAALEREFGMTDR